jgi:hypothetical protein
LASQSFKWLWLEKAPSHVDRNLLETRRPRINRSRRRIPRLVRLLVGHIPEALVGLDLPPEKVASGRDALR